MYVSTERNQKDSSTGQEKSGIYQLDATDFTVIRFYPAPSQFDFKHFKVVSSEQNERIVTGGAFGLIVFDCFNPKNEIRIKEHQFTGVNFDEHRDLVVAGTADHMKFYKLDSAHDVNIHGM